MSEKRTFLYDHVAEEISMDASPDGDIDKIVVDELKLRGFLVVRHNHHRVQHRMLGEVAEYFALNEEEKQRIAGGGNMKKLKGRPVGYSHRGSAEFVDLHLAYARGGSRLIPLGFDSSRVRVPVLAYVAIASGITKALCRSIERYLTGNNSATALEQCVDLLPMEERKDGVSNSTIRFCHYRDGGFGPHTDASFFTVIACTGGGGSSLEILCPEDGWRPVDELVSDDVSVVVFPGDFMSIISDDKIPATVHRATPGSTGEDRISVPILFRAESSVHWPCKMHGMLDCEEALAMDDLEAFCSIKRKRLASQQRGDDDNWVLRTREDLMVDMMG